jgi:hypothetical protein
MYKWTRDDVRNVRLGLLIGVPTTALFALEAFKDYGSPLLRFLVVAAIAAEVALAVKLVLTQRAFAAEDADHG